MKRIIVPAILAGVFALVLVTGQVRGDGPQPPPPPGGGTPLATIAPPCSPSGCPTNTPLPTATPLPTDTPMPTSTPLPLFLHVKL
ncbi:MAG: hypothetical protein ACRDFX_02170 [Chloroflexota bacterium]